eukprot:scaffold426_cov219-Amphora_coffeaeformis.AAC.65
MLNGIRNRELVPDIVNLEVCLEQDKLKLRFRGFIVGRNSFTVRRLSLSKSMFACTDVHVGQACSTPFPVSQSTTSDIATAIDISSATRGIGHVPASKISWSFDRSA